VLHVEAGEVHDALAFSVHVSQPHGHAHAGAIGSIWVAPAVTRP
jgi:hypothetical protein